MSVRQLWSGCSRQSYKATRPGKKYRYISPYRYLYENAAFGTWHVGPQEYRKSQVRTSRGYHIIEVETYLVPSMQVVCRMPLPPTKCLHIYRHATGRGAIAVPGRLHTNGRSCTSGDRRLQNLSAPVPGTAPGYDEPAEASPTDC